MTKSDRQSHSTDCNFRLLFFSNHSRKVFPSKEIVRQSVEKDLSQRRSSTRRKSFKGILFRRFAIKYLTFSFPKRIAYLVIRRQSQRDAGIIEMILFCKLNHNLISNSVPGISRETINDHVPIRLRVPDMQAEL